MWLIHPVRSHKPYQNSKERTNKNISWFLHCTRNCSAVSQPDRSEVKGQEWGGFKEAWLYSLRSDHMLVHRGQGWAQLATGQYPLQTSAGLSCTSVCDAWMNKAKMMCSRKIWHNWLGNKVEKMKQGNKCYQAVWFGMWFKHVKIQHSGERSETQGRSWISRFQRF